jgi:cysteine desulfurase
MLYLDNNASTRPDDRVVEAMHEMLAQEWANPSSVHRFGQTARARVELARRAVANLINASPREIIFTSGGTESICAVVLGLLRARQSAERRVIVTTAVEHAAVREVVASLVPGMETRCLPLGPGGIVDVDGARDMLTDDVALVSMQWANNETGAIQPLEAIGELCRERGIPCHSDATQWVGRMPTDVRELPVDTITFSAHKFHGPKGAGAIWARRGVAMQPIMFGSQELGRRGGTENTSGIVGMGVACEVAGEWLADPDNRARVASMRDRLEREILTRCPGACVNGPTDPDKRLWNTTNIGFPRLEGEALLMLLSERGVCASAGAACSSGSLEPSPILRAMGVAPEVAHGSIRLSLSRETTEAELDEAIETVCACVERLGASSESALA